MQEEAMELALNQCSVVHAARYWQARGGKNGSRCATHDAAKIWQTWCAGVCGKSLLEALALSEHGGRRDLSCVFLHEVTVRVNMRGTLRDELRGSILDVVGGAHPAFVHVWKSGAADVVHALLEEVDAGQGVRSLVLCIQQGDHVGVWCLLQSLHDCLKGEERAWVVREARRYAVRASATSVHRACEIRLQIEHMVQNELGSLP